MKYKKILNLFYNYFKTKKIILFYILIFTFYINIKFNKLIFR